MKRMLALLCCAVLFCSVLGLSTSAAASPPRVVRVAMTDLDNFFLPQNDGSMSGYGGDYLAKISEYTGWQFEFVPGTWSESLENLENGTVDLLFPAEYSPDRGEKYLYSDVQCTINYVTLLSRADNRNFYYEDYAAFDGMKVGMIEGNFLNLSFERFAQQHGFFYTPHYYKSVESMNAALAARQVDAVINGNFNTAQNQKLLAKFDYMPSYFITTKSNEALMNELDAALYRIGLECPDFATRLGDKYFSSTIRQAQSLSRPEAQFIADSAPLVVLCDPDNYPFEWYNAETGQFEGVNIDLLKRIARISGLQFDYTNVGSMTNAWQAMQNGRGDIISGVYASDALAQQYHLTFTESYLTETKVFVAQNLSVFTTADPITVATRSSQIGMNSYLLETYPHWNLLTTEPSTACLQLVADGKADAAFLSALALQTTPGLNSFSDLSIVSTMNEAVPICLGVHDETNPVLLDILNKAIMQITPQDIEQATVKNCISRAEPTTLKSVLQDNPNLRTGTLIAVCFLIFLWLFVLYRNQMQTEQARLLQAKNEELQEAIALAQHAERAREHYDQLYNTAVCGILQAACNPESQTLRLVNANKEAVRLTGLSLSQSSDELRRHLHRLLSDASRASLWALASALGERGDKCPLDLQLEIGEKENIWISGTAELIQMHGPEKVLQLTFMDTTRRKQQEETLRTRSQTDLLTGLLNKSTAEQRFAEYFETESTPAAFFVIDIDDFKGINDTYGHAYGDELLRQVGQCLATQFRSGDIVGRIGGDEFAALLRGAQDEGSILRRAQRLCTAISGIRLPTEEPTFLSCSIGIARSSHPNARYDELFDQADKALYRVKREGKSGCMFYAPENASAE